MMFSGSKLCCPGTRWLLPRRRGCQGLPGFGRAGMGGGGRQVEAGREGGGGGQAVEQLHDCSGVSHLDP